MAEIGNQQTVTRKICVGLIGAGNWAGHGHLRLLDLLPNYEVVAVQARRRAAAEDAARSFGIRHVVASEAEFGRFVTPTSICPSACGTTAR